MLKSRIRSTLIIKASLFLTLSLIAASPALAQQEQQQGKWVGPGVRYYSIAEPDTPLAIYVLEVDITQPDVTLELGVSNDRLTENETLRSMAQRLDWEKHRIVGAVNGDFWAEEGVPVGMAIREKLLLRSPSFRSVFALNSEKRPFIDNFNMNIKITASKGGSLQLGDINTYPRGNNPVLFTPIRARELVTPLGAYIVSLAPETWELHPQDSVRPTGLRAGQAAHHLGNGR